MLIPSLILFLLGQAPPVDPATRVEGRVIDSASRQPVAGARVILVRVDQPGTSYGGEIYKVEPAAGEADPAAARSAVLTGIEGRFSFRLNAPAEFMLFVDAAGYVRTQLRFGSGVPTYKLKPGEPLSGITLAIEAEGAIGGRVTDIDSRRGIAGLVVQAFRYRAEVGYRMFTAAGNSATTLEDGSYELKGLDPGEYYLQVSPKLMAAFQTPRPEQPFRDAEQTGYGRTYYPSGERPEQAAPVSLMPGSRLDRVDVRLSKRRVAGLRGRVHGPPGTKATLLLFELRHGRDSRSFHVIAKGSAAAGELFQLDNVSPGNYELQAAAGESFGGSLRAKLFLEVADRNLDGLDLHLATGLTVTGRVRLAPAEGEAREELPLPSGGPPMIVGLNSTRGIGAPGETPAKVDPGDGKFTKPAVFPDEYRVNVAERPKGYRVAEVRYNNILGDWNTIRIDAGADRHQLDIVLRPAASSLQVTVTDGMRPVTGAMVSLVREPVTETSLQITAQPVVTDSDGRAPFSGLLAGRYRVLAFPAGVLWRDDPQLPHKTNAAQQVVLSPDTPHTIQIRVQP